MPLLQQQHCSSVGGVPQIFISDYALRARPRSCNTTLALHLLEIDSAHGRAASDRVECVLLSVGPILKKTTVRVIGQTSAYTNCIHSFEYTVPTGVVYYVPSLFRT